MVKFLIENKNDFVLYPDYIILKEIITFLTFIAYFIIYIVYTQIKYKKIKINMDPNYKDIIDLYNKRRIQKYFLAGIILQFIACIYEVYYSLQKCCDIKQRNMNDINKRIKEIEQDNLSSTIISKINNNTSNTIEEQINQNVEIIQSSVNRIKESLKFSIHADEKIIKFEK